MFNREEPPSNSYKRINFLLWLYSVIIDRVITDAMNPPDVGHLFVINLFANKRGLWPQFPVSDKRRPQHLRWIRMLLDGWMQHIILNENIGNSLSLLSNIWRKKNNQQKTNTFCSFKFIFHWDENLYEIIFNILPIEKKTFLNFLKIDSLLKKKIFIKVYKFISHWDEKLWFFLMFSHWDNNLYKIFL